MSVTPETKFRENRRLSGLLFRFAYLVTSLILFVGKDKDTLGLQKAKSTKVSNDIWKKAMRPPRE